MALGLTKEDLLAAEKINSDDLMQGLVYLVEELHERIRILEAHCLGYSDTAEDESQLTLPLGDEK